MNLDRRDTSIFGKAITMLDENFKYLQIKEVYEFLEGSGKQDLVTYKGHDYGLPYLTASDLGSYCAQFGVHDVGGSRWTYVESLLQYAIENNRCDELLNFFFDLSHFKDLQVRRNNYFFDDTPRINSLEEAEDIHKRIIEAAVDHINELISLTRHELKMIDGHFYVVEVGRKPVIITHQLDKFSSDYVANLRERCKEDLVNGNYDSVVTKSRTLMEETLIHIMEKAKQDGLTTDEPDHSGNLGRLYNQVKTLRNMRQLQTNDQRVNELLGGLEKIVNSIASMRNTDSDAHGVGQKRININGREARLIMNCSMAFCEYLVTGKND